MRYVYNGSMWVPQYTIGSGLGTWIARQLHRVGISQKVGCGCARRQATLDMIGGRRRGNPFPISGAASGFPEEPVCSDLAAGRATPVIFCDNYEQRLVNTNDLSAQIPTMRIVNGWGVPNSPSDPAVHVVNTDFHDGSQSMFCNYPANSGTGQNSCGWNETSIPTNPRTVYVRWWVKYSPSYVIARENNTKQMEITNSQANSTHLGHMGGVQGEKFKVFVQDVEVVAGGAPGSCNSLTTPTPFPSDGNCVQLGQNVGTPFSLIRDQWICFEYRLTHNSSSTINDGVLEGWINDVKTMSYTNVFFERGQGFWNFMRVTGAGFGSSSPGSAYPAMYRYWDQFVVSAQRIGCAGGAVTPPAQPKPYNTGTGVGFAGQVISGGR